jgi:acetyltransferase-like isoleucine patch superfamily enzyme
MKSLLFLLRRILNFFYFAITNVILHMNKVKHGKLTVNGILYVVNSGKIYLGDNIRINSSKFNNMIGGDTRTTFVVKPNATLTLGDNVRISNSAIYCANRIEIGDNVLIGGSCKIWDTDFHSLQPELRKENPNANYHSRPIFIGNNVFIGGFSIILKGVTIGDNAIIGAGSVISKSIPANEIWAGNPAIKIKDLQ